MACKICGGPTQVTHKGVILGKHEVAYHLCEVCEFCCTDEPFWLEEAYSQAIAATDTGLVQRNLAVARSLRMLLPRLFPTGPYVDWAGGYGMLVRLLRDDGLECYWQDRYAPNLLARGFEWEANRAGRNASVATAIEALEHAPDPLSFLSGCLAGTGARAVLFTQVLHSGRPDPDWWYLAPAAGQHVSFFSAKTLAEVAERLGMHLSSFGELHLLSCDPVSAAGSRWALRGGRLASRASARFWSGRRRASLTWADHLRLTEQLTADG